MMIPSPEKLLEIIKTQVEISKAGYDLNFVMTLVSQKAQSLTGAVGAVVELAEGEDMVYRAATGSTERLLGLRLKRSNSLSGLCVEQGQVLTCEDVDNDSRVDREACKRVGVKSMVVSPLKYNDKAVGVLKVFSDKTTAFNQEDAQTIALMSELVSSAMYYSTEYHADQIFYKATHDPLTDLANRALFYDRFRFAIAQATRNNHKMAMLMFDMDGLKQVNDRWGHRAGDSFIKEFALRLNQLSRKTDTVARLGGDEFGIILSKIGETSDVDIFTKRFHKHMAKPFMFENCPLTLSSSVGFSVYPDDAKDIEQLVEQADQSMYRQKRLRKNLPQ